MPHKCIRDIALTHITDPATNNLHTHTLTHTHTFTWEGITKHNTDNHPCIRAYLGTKESIYIMGNRDRHSPHHAKSPTPHVSTYKPWAYRVEWWPAHLLSSVPWPGTCSEEASWSCPCVPSGAPRTACAAATVKICKCRAMPQE